eukprot:216579-Hanusia_phi.AAC.3
MTCIKPGKVLPTHLPLCLLKLRRTDACFAKTDTLFGLPPHPPISVLTLQSRQSPEVSLAGTDENGQCVGKWSGGMLLVTRVAALRGDDGEDQGWALGSILGLLAIGVCIHFFFDAMDLSVVMGKRRLSLVLAALLVHASPLPPCLPVSF